MSRFIKVAKYAGDNRNLPGWQRILCTSVKDLDTDAVKPEYSKAKQEFRVLQITPKREKGIQDKSRDPDHKLRMTDSDLGPDVKYREDVDWTNVWVGPKTFDPYMVPLPLKQGYVKKGEPPGKYANAELMKIPNFLHLTPPAIQKHCEALQKFCTKWPENLRTEEDMDKHFPITIIASDYCHSSPTIRDPLSRIVTLKVNVNSLGFDKHAKDKFLRLVGNRYDPKTENVFITAKNCPLKKQNYDHAMFILTALCFESWRVEDWEKLKSTDDLEEYCFHLRKSKTNMDAYFDYSGMPHASLERISEILEKYVTHNEESEQLNSLKDEIVKILNLPKFN